MLRIIAAIALMLGGCAATAQDTEEHRHPAPEKLGNVDFPTSCSKAVAAQFTRAVALLHSFAYTDAERTFRDVAARDANCPIARWGIAMSLYHELWEPPSGADLAEGAHQIELAAASKAGSAREHQFIDALKVYYTDVATKPAPARADAYAEAMARIAAANPDDTEMQIFHALALLATAPPADKTHAKQKQAVAILEPIYAAQPQHPGLAHYLIHACDSAELAAHGLAAARAYSQIAPSAPHALHMPSHIFTRLGLWEDSIASNRAARAASQARGDIGEALHAMDYMVYAYLQRGRTDDAQRVVDDLHAMPRLAAAQFKIGYAANAMPVRLAVELHDWKHAATLQPLPGSPPHVAAIVHWARALAAARSGDIAQAEQHIAALETDLRDTRANGTPYWAGQVAILLDEARAWCLAAAGQNDAAVDKLRAAADAEDAVEKLPVTPGPIVPAREQLGELLLAQHRAADALREFRASLQAAPRRRAGLLGAIAAAEALDDKAAAARFRAELAGIALPPETGDTAAPRAQ